MTEKNSQHPQTRQATGPFHTQLELPYAETAEEADAVLTQQLAQLARQDVLRELAQRDAHTVETLTDYSPITPPKQ